MYPPADLTGVNPDYLVINDVFQVFTANQVIQFPCPIFLNSLVITVGGSAFSQTTDWTVNEFDTTATARAKALSGTFSASLVKSILINSPRAQPYVISCNYQQFYQDQIAVILGRLTADETRLNSLISTSATTPSAPRLLPVDATKSLAANVVTDAYNVNTYVGQNLIVPVCGAFFADSVVITLPTNPLTTLVRDTDYIIIDLDRTKTTNTPNTSGVYRSILLTRQYAGTLNVTTHAYGGDATLSDITSIYQLLTQLNTYLAANTFLTPASLGAASVVSSIISRLQALEAKTAALP
jgi:hypothetical protein